MVGILVYVFAIEAVFLALLIKILDGGLKTEATLHYIVLIIGLMIVYYVTDIGLSILLPSVKSTVTLTPTP